MWNLNTCLEPERQDHSLGETTWHVSSTEVLLFELGTKEKTAHGLANCNLTTRCWEANAPFIYSQLALLRHIDLFPMEFSINRVSSIICGYVALYKLQSILPVTNDFLWKGWFSFSFTKKKKNIMILIVMHL